MSWNFREIRTKVNPNHQISNNIMHLFLELEQGLTFSSCELLQIYYTD